jgi:transposase
MITDPRNPEDRSPCPSSTRRSSGGRVLDLIAAGRRVATAAADLDISDPTIYQQQRKELTDTDQMSDTTSADSAELGAARLRIPELEAEVAIHPRAAVQFADSTGHGASWPDEPQGPSARSLRGGMLSPAAAGWPRFTGDGPTD